MQSIYEWAITKMNAMFCVVAGAPIYNNRMEEKLKIPIRGRKTAHFYKTDNGAGVANVLISLFATTAQANENSFDYLLALQKNSDKVKANPAAWLPWTYRETLANENLISPSIKLDSS